MAGHPGPEKTIELVKRNFYWPGMSNFITTYVQSCETCQRVKAPRGKVQPPLQPLPVPPRPWAHITADFITGLPKTKRGNNAIFVIVDRFSKMGIFLPCKDTVNSEDTANFIMKHVITKYGLPLRFTSDRGPQFASKFTKEICKMLGIEMAMSTAYHPQTDGQTERVNQELEQYLRCYVNYDQDDWDQYLHTAEYAYNNREHSSIKMSPFRAVYGRDCTLNISPQKSIAPAAEDYSKRLVECQQHAKEALFRTQEQMKEYADKHRTFLPTFKEGDEVLLDARNLNRQIPTVKLGDRFVGPFKILKKHGPVNFELELPDTMRIHPVFHAGLLKEFKRQEYPGREALDRPDPEVREGEEEYIVDKIIDGQPEGGRFKYLIHWKGYSPADRTWEYFNKDLRHASESIKEYHDDNPDKPKPRGLIRWLERNRPEGGYEDEISTSSDQH